jgi:hypothetical protein
MRFPLLLIFAVLTLASACNKKVATANGGDDPVTGAVKTITFGTTETMKIGETCRLEKSNAAITFVEVVSDNRCPRGVNCIQAGEAVVMVKVGGGSPQRIKIDTSPKTKARLPIDGGTVEILALNPYPEDGVRIDPAQLILQIRTIAGQKMR